MVQAHPPSPLRKPLIPRRHSLAGLCLAAILASALGSPADPVWLDLNDAEAIARFILEKL